MGVDSCSYPSSSDVDLFSDANILDPYDAYRQLREAGPIVWLSHHQVWAVARYDGVRSVLKDIANFTSAVGVSLNAEFNEYLQGTTLASDPPLHDTLRNIVASSLTPRALADRKTSIDAQADQLVASLVERGRFDAVADLARVLPLAVVPDFIGLPEHGRDQMLGWATATFNAIGPLNERAKEGFAALEAMGAYACERVAKRDLCPGSLGEGVLVAADQGCIRPEQCAGLLIDYLAPSLDTTVGAVSNALWLFANHPDQWAMVRSDPALIPNAFNEVLRLESPVRGFCRHASRPAVFEGAALQEGDAVLALFASANRDERKWTEPEVFDVTRRCSDHVAFGFGVHGCAGQGLARIEAQAILSALAKRVDRIDLIDCARTVNNITRSFASLQIAVS
jgi:cytochrome P450